MSLKTYSCTGDAGAWGGCGRPIQVHEIDLKRVGPFHEVVCPHCGKRTKVYSAPRPWIQDGEV